MELNELDHSDASSDDPVFSSSALRRLKRISSRMSKQRAQPHVDECETIEESKEEEAQEKEELKPLSKRIAERKGQQQKYRPKASRRGRGSRALRRFNAKAQTALDLFILWRKSIYKIGGHFGGGVQSYFVFLRFLVILNFLSFLLIAGFVLIPTIVFNSLQLNTSLPDLINTTGKEVCLVYDHRPQVLTSFFTYFLDLLSGTGFMEYSYMFYGYYNNTMVVADGFSYNIPLAYLLTASFYFLFCLIFITNRMGGVLRLAVSTRGGPVEGYCRMVFTGWDYGLQGDRATRLKQKNIYQQLKEELMEEKLQLEAESRTLFQTVGLYAKRTVLNIINLGLIGGAFVGIAYATQFSQAQAGREGIVGFLLEYLPSIIITVSNLLIPFLCDMIIQLEKHSPSTTVIMALLRGVCLRLVSVAVLVFTIWESITCVDNESDCTPCQYNHHQYPCWETRVGQEMYKLTIFDFLTSIALFLVEFPQRMLVDHCSWSLIQWWGHPEFLVPDSILELVYAQTLVWIGALFCPLLPLINTIKFVIIFYCKKIALFHNCSPAGKTFRSTWSNFVFFLVLLFGWSLATIVLIYSMTKLHPSYGCGPFRFSSTMWSTVPNSFHGLSVSTQEFLRYAGSQAFSVPFFLSSCVALCCVASLASAYGKSVALLKAQLKEERRDTQFLVKQVKEFSEPKTSIPKAFIPRDPILPAPSEESLVAYP